LLFYWKYQKQNKSKGIIVKKLYIILILAHSTIVNACYEGPALHRAVINNDLAKIQQFIDQKANLNEKDYLENIPLNYAVALKNYKAIELLADKSNPDQKNRYGQTARKLASNGGTFFIRMQDGFGTKLVKNELKPNLESLEMIDHKQEKSAKYAIHCLYSPTGKNLPRDLVFKCMESLIGKKKALEFVYKNPNVN
jgi:ankyrin repeat protein